MALSLSLTLLNAFLDLISFSGILYSIYPPLFAALLLYSVGGTAISIAIGKVRTPRAGRHARRPASARLRCAARLAGGLCVRTCAWSLEVRDQWFSNRVERDL